VEQATFEELMASIREMKEIEAGRRAPARETPLVELDVSEIRAETGLTQEEFATVLGISPRTLQEWEQGRRRPRGPARSLLLVAKHDPRAVIDGVRAGLETA